MSNNKHTPFIPTAIASFSIGDEDSIKNRYQFRDWSIKPFVLDRKQLVTDEVTYPYVELDQKIKANGLIYIVRIFTEKKQHQVQAFVYPLGQYTQAQMIGDFIETDNIFKARAICFNWYLSNITKKQQLKEGFLVESDEAIAAKQTIYQALPWSMRWMLRRFAFGFFCVYSYIELVKNKPVVAATLAGYVGASIAVVILIAWGIASIKQFFAKRDPDFFDGLHIDDGVDDSNTVTFKKAAK